MLKKFLKRILAKYNYQICKNLDEKSERFEFASKNEWLKKYQIDTIIDIGANEGQFAQKILTLFPESAIHCFEPIPAAHKVLKEKLSEIKKAKFYQFALGETESEIKMNINEYSPSSSFLTMEKKHKVNFDFAVETHHEIMKVKTLDTCNILATENMLVKIDVQGFEEKVINGGTEILKCAKVLILEVSFERLYKGQPLFNELYTKLYNLGFNYSGNLEQLRSPLNGEILQADAIFIRR